MISMTDVRSAAQTTPVSEYAPQNLNKISVLYPPTPVPFPGKISCHPIIFHPPCKRSPQTDVALLDQAEALAEDAFRKVSPFNPNATLADKLEAQQEMQEAQQIRNEVRPDLDLSQQQTLDQLNNEEQAVTEASTGNGSNIFTQIFNDFDELAKMADGEQKSRSLDNSILGFPEPSPISFPIFPFGQIS